MTTIKLNPIEKRDLIIELSHITSSLYIRTQFLDPYKMSEEVAFTLSQISTIECFMRTICNTGYIMSDFTPNGLNDSVWWEGSEAGFNTIKNVLYDELGIRIDE